MKLCVITLCFNEDIILPFFIRHYEQFADRIVFYDGMSTDRTREIISACPIAELRDLDTGGQLDDGANIAVKNNAYRSMDGDWFIIVDCDEFLVHPDLRGFLAKCDELNINAVRCEGWNMIGDAVPEGGSLIAAMAEGVRDDYTIAFFDKLALIRKDADVQFAPGAHQFELRNGRRAPGLPVKLLHYKWLSLDYVRSKARKLRLSQNNLNNGWGVVDNAPSGETWADYYIAARPARQRVELTTRERWKTKLGMLAAHLFPSPSHMRDMHRHRHPAGMPFWYAERVARALMKSR